MHLYLFWMFCICVCCVPVPACVESFVRLLLLVFLYLSSPVWRLYVALLSLYVSACVCLSLPICAGPCTTTKPRPSLCVRVPLPSPLYVSRPSMLIVRFVSLFICRVWAFYVRPFFGFPLCVCCCWYVSACQLKLFLPPTPAPTDGRLSPMDVCLFCDTGVVDVVAVLALLCWSSVFYVAMRRWSNVAQRTDDGWWCVLCTTVGLFLCRRGLSADVNQYSHTHNLLLLQPRILLCAFYVLSSHVTLPFGGLPHGGRRSTHRLLTPPPRIRRLFGRFPLVVW